MSADRRPPRWLKPMNRILTAAVRAGLRPGPAMVLTVPGRRTGRPRSTPMTPFRHEGRLYVVAGYPGSDWAANARAAGLGTLRHGRRSRTVRIVELDAEQSRPVLRAFAVKVPVGVAFSRRAGLVGEGSPDEFAALAGRLAVFRFDPEHTETVN
ncbi:nitroreductase family deazaflavin-dependent oxidoreductase [Mycolicibacterium sp. 018/SC-01/001]|uniref:nitroreductase family deazaflavin-dependent oxidoreductase n=1 Tax=Mycolicibacterium sp. 018/SC-01/001 TaxID=2592069 RepID=UPI00117CD77A|nr:nitroreductase family deazaflavin-dependent oxidoreductase [Mycolicibacterium sp. 018/SC-01/001]TRW80701.1 nitroreductase family deazaflavin-dependent oxidoreductase [Mycolicibacterium sp. 018/SC-01/001]